MQGDYFSSPTVKFLKFIYERNKTQIFFCVLFSIVYAFEYFKNTYFQKEQINNMNTKSLEQAFLTDISTIRDAIISLSKSTLQICVLVDKDKRIIGIISRWRY